MDQHTFLFQAMVYLAAAVIMVPIAKKLGLGSVLGYLLAGVVIGPTVMGFIGEEGQDLMHAAEFGVVMMLFIIGLELEPQLLWKMRKSIAGLGGLQVIGSSLLMAGLAIGFNLPWKQALALGMILSLSSTAIVLQTLNEKGLMKTAAGQSSFAVLLFQDIAVIPMLALFPLLVDGTADAIAPAAAEHGKTLTDNLPGWGKALVVLGTVGAIILAGRFLIRPLFRIIAATKLREVFTATALLLVVGIAELMTQVGLSPALGTFLAGVVLADSEYRHELESDIEPFKGLLLGLFFIAVGASIDFGLIMQEPWTIMGLVALLMVVKGFVLFILGKFFGLRKDQNVLFSVGLSQVGEFAFVLLSFSLQEHILPAAIVDRMVAVVAISMAATPLLMLLNERLIMPYVGVKEEDEREADAIEERNPVIVAGFGAFGNTIGRFLRANNIKATFLDNDSDRVELLRNMGFKVYYGDASRHDLLEAAGAAHAKVIVIAIDNMEKRMEMIETLKKHFPNLHIFVRARHRFDAYDLMNAGMLHVYRETVDTALRLSEDVLTFLGYRAYKVHRAAQTFLKYDERVLKELASISDNEEYIVAAKSHIEELERLLQADEQKEFGEFESGWDEDSLIAEANKAAVQNQ